MIITNYTDYPFLLPFIEKKSRIASEYLEAKNTLEELKFFFKNNDMPKVFSHFDYWVKESGFDMGDIGYDARGEKPVGGFPLYKLGFPIQWYDVEKNFPTAYNLLMQVPELHFAQFSIMSPNSHILPHQHKIQHSHIFHINLFDLDGEAIFTAGNQSIALKKAGDNFLFNPALMHESKNNSNSYRVNLMFDFRT